MTLDFNEKTAKKRQIRRFAIAIAAAVLMGAMEIFGMAILIKEAFL